MPVLSAIDGHGQPILDILPNFFHVRTGSDDLHRANGHRLVGELVSGRGTGGGSYIAQRMLASKSEKDSLGGTLFFNLAHYVLRPWPWIITALCSIIVFPELKDIQAAFPGADVHLIGHDSAFPAMLKFLPAGFVGTDDWRIDRREFVHDPHAFELGFVLSLLTTFTAGSIKPQATEKHYVMVGRICTLGLYVCAALLSLKMTSAQQAFQILLTIGAGTGLLYLLRWFWWRINAWCEVVAMTSSFVISIAFLILEAHRKNAGLDPLPFAHTIVISVAFTTICWLIAAFVTPATDRDRLVSFYKKVHPAGPGWSVVRLQAGVTEAEAALHGDHMGMATAGWISGCATIWSSLFAIGNFLYGRMSLALILTGVFIVSGSVLLWVINHLWDKNAVKTNPVTESAKVQA